MPQQHKLCSVVACCCHASLGMVAVAASCTIGLPARSGSLVLLVLLLLLLLHGLLLAGLLSPERAGCTQVSVDGCWADPDQARTYGLQPQLLHCRPAMAATKCKIVVIITICKDGTQAAGLVLIAAHFGASLMH